MKLEIKMALIANCDYVTLETFGEQWNGCDKM
jgi:hypothetical protein